MPSYDIRCRSCGDTFEITRSMANIDDPAPCPSGHTDTVRLLRTVAMTARSGSGSSAGLAASAGPAASAGEGGGCCGGGCCN